jgi:DNA-binding HxlR family transcriptional regulator
MTKPQRLYSYRIISELENGPRTLRELKGALGDVSYGALAVALHRLKERDLVIHRHMVWSLPEKGGSHADR